MEYIYQVATLAVVCFVKDKKKPHYMLVLFITGKINDTFYIVILLLEA